MQRLLIQFLAIILIAVAGGLAYVHINSSETLVVSSPEPAITATPLPVVISPHATALPAQPRANAASPVPGWGQTTLYIGKYRLVASSNPKLASTGRLTIFPGSGAEIGGTLSLPPPSQAAGSYLADFYLTSFAHHGMVRSTTINLGSATGPAVGTLVVQSYKNNKLIAHVTFQGEPTLTLQFDHYSATP